MREAQQSSISRPLLELCPKLAERMSFFPLAELPTAVESLDIGDDVFVKRDDRTSTVYGGNKVRTLEVLFGEARRRGAERIFATGAFGSNHAVATVLHAPRAQLRPGAILFPQPYSAAAAQNLRVLLGQPGTLMALPHWSVLPAGMLWVRHRERMAGRGASIMLPGGATPLGALGYVSAALELARQVAGGQAPMPREVVIAVGSTCTTSGLLVGFAIAVRRVAGFANATGAPPLLRAVRVTPWPVTSRLRIIGLAVRTARLLARLEGDPTLAVSRQLLERHLVVDGRFIGRGYGFPTEAGLHAQAEFERRGGPRVDTTYSAKSAAATLARVRENAPRPLLYWATKSTMPLPEAPIRLDAPSRMTRWLGQ